MNNSKKCDSVSLYFTHSSVNAQPEGPELNEATKSRTEINRDLIHTEWVHNGPITTDLLDRFKCIPFAGFLHALVNKGNFDANTRDRDIIILIFATVRYVRKIRYLLTRYSNVLNRIPTNFHEKCLHLNIRAHSTDPKRLPLCENLEIMLSETILTDAIDQGLLWKVNGEGGSPECTGRLELEVHLTPCSFYIGLEVLNFYDFRPYFQFTRTYGNTFFTQICSTNVRPYETVLDLFSGYGEVLLEFIHFTNTFCFGFVQNFNEGLCSLRNKQSMKMRNSDRYELIATNVKEFFNYYAVDLIISRYTFGKNVPSAKVEEFYRVTEAVLKLCRPCVSGLIITPNSLEHCELFQKYFHDNPYVKIRRRTLVYEYNREYYSIAVESSVPSLT